MLRFLSKLVRKSPTANTVRTPHRVSRRAMLGLEGLEDRMVLSTASLNGSTLLVNPDVHLAPPNHPHPSSIASLHGSTLIVNDLGGSIEPPIRGGIPGLITFQEDRINHALLDVLYSGELVGKFKIAKIKTVDINLVGFDIVNVDDSNGLPFASGTTVALSGSGERNGFNLLGSRTISGGETYTAGNGAQPGSLTLGGDTFEFTSAIFAVDDEVKTTGPLVVKAFGQHVEIDGIDFSDESLGGLSNNGAGNEFLFANKNLVTLDLISANATANLVGWTAPPGGEQSFVVDLMGDGQVATIQATPNSVATSIVAAGSGDGVNVNANSGLVLIQGNSTTVVNIGTSLNGGTTSDINADVSIGGAQVVNIMDGGNNTTQENVLVTESTISGTGLFGNNAVVVQYSNIGSLQIETGTLAESYTVAASTPGASFTNSIVIDDESEVGLSVVVTLDSSSGLNLTVDNAVLANPAPAALLISAVGGTFNPSSPTTPTGSENVTFAGGLPSEVNYSNFASVTEFSGLP